MQKAETSARRSPGSVRLLAVSKTKPAWQLAEAYHNGQRHFGESYLQEALVKQRQLGHYDISWHFIGPIQSNKTRQIATNFSWVHSVERLKIAQRLSQQRPDNLPPLNICLQVNISREDSKSGILPEELIRLAEQIQQLPRITLRGLMAIPAPEADFERQRQPFRLLAESLRNLNNPNMDTLSCGMSNDMRAAIIEGATFIRIGSAIFGKRENQTPQ